jgi:hypothetical protein
MRVRPPLWAPDKAFKIKEIQKEGAREGSLFSCSIFVGAGFGAG